VISIVQKRSFIAGCIILCISLPCWLLLWRRPLRKAQIAISFSHFETHSNSTYAVIKVANVGTATAACYGYGREMPFYYIVTASGTNWSWDYSPGFDEDQARPIELPPGDSMSVRTGVPIPETWMIGIPYCEATDEEKLPPKLWSHFQRFNPLKKPHSVAWSQRLTRAAKPSNIVPLLTERTGDTQKASQKR